MLFLQSETKIKPDLRLVPGSKTVGSAKLRKGKHENKTAGNWERETATVHALIFSLTFSTETCRLRIRRHVWRLISAPDVNDLCYVALFVKPKRWVTCLHSFSLLALLFAHQSGKSFYMALKGCNRERIHRLTNFPRTKVSPFWLTKNTILHFTWLTLGARDFSSAVSGFCQVFVGLRPTPKIPAAREKNLWYPGILDLAYLRNVTTRGYHNDTMFTSSY